MYSYYILRGTQRGQVVELDGEVNEEDFPGIDLDDGSTIIMFLVQKLRDRGETGEWNECDLSYENVDREDFYIFFNNRWVRRSETPWRRDRA